MGTIYQLVCPKTKMPFYVGATFGDLRNRLSSHMVLVRKGKKESPVYNYIRKNDIVPIIEPLQSVRCGSIRELNRKEAKWVRRFLENGIELTNITHNYKLWYMSKKEKAAYFLRNKLID